MIPLDGTVLSLTWLGNTKVQFFLIFVIICLLLALSVYLLSVHDTLRILLEKHISIASDFSDS